MTRYFYDTEFLEDGSTIEFISIGIVCEDDREYYAVNADCDFKRIRSDDWLWDNVCRHLPTTKRSWEDPNQGRGVTDLDRSSALVKPKWVIANEVRDFLLAPAKIIGRYNGAPCIAEGTTPELWAYYGAYDHVALAQLWGKMIKLPDMIPMYTNDLMQEMDRLKLTFDESFLGTVPKPDNAHDALADARWNAQLFQALRFQVEPCGQCGDALT